MIAGQQSLARRVRPKNERTCDEEEYTSLPKPHLPPCFPDFLDSPTTRQKSQKLPFSKSTKLPVKPCVLKSSIVRTRTGCFSLTGNSSLHSFRCGRRSENLSSKIVAISPLRFFNPKITLTGPSPVPASSEFWIDSRTNASASPTMSLLN